MAQVAPHPGRTEAPMQQSAANPYFAPAQALATYNGQLANAKAQQANAGAEQAYAEQAIVQQAAAQQGLGAPVQQEQAQVDPIQVQVEQIAQAIIAGQVGPDQLTALVQEGSIDPAVAEAAVGMAQQYMVVQQSQEQAQAAQQAQAGLGQVQAV